MTIEEMTARKRELGYSYKEISRRSGIPLGTVQKIFGGVTRAPRMETVQALEKVFRREEGEPASPAHVQIPAGISAQPPVQSALQSPVGTDTPQRSFQGWVYANCATESMPAPRISPLRKRQGEYTLEDYDALPDDIRVELIDGVIYDMASPSETHQLISMELSYQLRDAVRKNRGKCRVFAAPFDVQLDKDNKTMVQPDILVVCDRSQMGSRGVYGAPDLVIEVLSPSTARKDMSIKLRKYMTAGVREYWIVDPEEKQVLVYLRQGENVLIRTYTFDDQVPVGIWENRCSVDFPDIREQMKEWLGE